MPIPSTPDLRRPVLEAHGEGEPLRADDLVARLTPVLGLSDDDLAQRQSSGDGTFVQRMNWAREHLVIGGLLSRPEHGVTELTPKGADFIASGEEPPAPRNDWADLAVDRDAVLRAIEEFRRNGRDETLRAHGFKRALDYVVSYDGEELDAKALYGVAFGYAHPDEEPARHRGLQGGGQLVKLLQDLGFEVQRKRGGPPSPDEAAHRVWIVRAGREGRYEQLALQEGVCLIGWSDLGPLSPGVTRDELKERIRDVQDEHRAQSVASQAGQVYRFVNELLPGDLVVLPLMTIGAHVAIGRVTGDYEFRSDEPFAGSDARSTHRVDWLAERVPYDRFDPDLRDAFGQQGTVSEITKPAARQRILDVVGGADASAIHLVLKWSATLDSETVRKHEQMAAAHGATWWGRVSKPGATGLADNWLSRLKTQIEEDSETFVFLYGGEQVCAPNCWPSRLTALMWSSSSFPMSATRTLTAACGSSSRTSRRLTKQSSSTATF